MTSVVAIVFFTLWPEYAGDSLLPRLQKVLANTLALAPGGSASTSEDQILKMNSETMHVLTEFLEIAEDARLEGRTCAVYHNGIVEAAGALRRISNRLSSIASARVLVQMPQLDPVTELARERVFNAIRGQLSSWLDFFNSAEWSNALAARAIAEKHSADELAEPLNEFSSQLEEGGFARLASWPFEPRRTMMAELQSMRGLVSPILRAEWISGRCSQPPSTRFTHRVFRGVIHRHAPDRRRVEASALCKKLVKPSPGGAIEFCIMIKLICPRWYSP